MCATVNYNCILLWMYIYTVCVTVQHSTICYCGSFSSKVVERILFVHAKMNRGIGYVQVYTSMIMYPTYILLCFIHYYS